MNRNFPRALRLAFSLALVPLLGAVSPPAAPAGVEPVSFDWFEYTGRDTVFATPLPPGSYRNPILAGFYPDPSITRVGNKFYLVSSTFAYFPSLPVFESADLVHWKQIGNAIGPPAQLDFDGLDISRGVFAPDIEFHDGTFYVLNTAVDSGGNYFVTARNPAGPWSAPVWLPELDGIDPSLFFDTDGKAYILNNGPPAGKPLYPGHRAIWIQEVRLPAGKLFGERKVLVNGGVDISTKPVWIEGPHLYRRQEWYYLMCAEGGTGPGHSEVVLRSHSPWGPFMPYAGNPILTQRDLADDRANPVANAGHADLVEAPDGSWWATFLASRTYERTHYNTGRETFLLPVTWRDGWPLILARGQSVPYVVHGPGFMTRGTQAPFSGNFTWRDDFDSDVLKHEWLNARVPKKPWADLRSRPGTLTIHPLPASLDTLENPSFLARRQQHTAFDASTAFELPQAARVSAGIAVFQNEKFWYWLGSHRTDHGAEVFLQRQNGPTPETVATAPLAASGPLKLRISADARAYSFLYDPDGKGWRALRQNEDGSLLSTDIAGGFVGAMVGPFARAE